jgi:very-short-patch-repair endonuclease
MGALTPTTQLWRLVRRQHGVVTHAQLRGFGYTDKAIKHRLERGRLHRVHRGVYAVGRRELTREGTFMAAVLACGPYAVLSHDSAAELWGIARAAVKIEVSVPRRFDRSVPGIVVHRRRLDDADVTTCKGIPVITPACTPVDYAARHSDARVERAISEADKRDLIDPEELRGVLEAAGRRRGCRALRDLLDRRTFRLTDSELERRFLAIARRAGLASPLTRQVVNGFRVDFYFPDIPLIVETDGLRYHRTAQQQARDRLRDQAHAAAKVPYVRFTHDQIAHDPRHVEATLLAAAR